MDKSGKDDIYTERIPPKHIISDPLSMTSTPFNSSLLIRFNEESKPIGRKMSTVSRHVGEILGVNTRLCVCGGGGT